MQNQRDGRQIAPSRSPIKDLSVYGEGGDLIAVGDGYGKSGRISPAFFRSLFSGLDAEWDTALKRPFHL